MNKLIFFPGQKKAAVADDEPRYLNVRYIPTDLIVSNPFQPRKNYDGEAIIRLADSIRRYGMIEPVGVRRYTSGKYEIVYGERRLRAARLIDMYSIPCVVLENISRRKSCELAYAENTLREPLNINERAQGVETLIRRFNMTRPEVCESLSIYRNEINFLLEILHLSEFERDILCNSSLTAAHMKHIMKIENVHVRRHLMNLIAENGIPASSCEEFIEEFLQKPHKTEKAKKKIKPRPVKKLILRDIRVFMNSIDHAVELMKSSGAQIKCDKQADDNSVSYAISVSQKRKEV